jgi:hypothetical protein
MPADETSVPEDALPCSLDLLRAFDQSAFARTVLSREDCWNVL